MKKTIFFLMAAAGILTACDPSQSEKDFDPVSLAASDVESAVYITQTDANGNPAADGNYFTYTTNPSMMVSIFNLDSEGAENQLARGYSGTFAIKPKRGSDPNQTFYVRTVNSDNSEVIITKQYTVYVQQELDPELRLLASDVYGKKIWKWDTSVTGIVWGNMGYCGGAGADVGISGNGQWWGVGLDESGELSEFMNQLQHTPDNAAHGDESIDAYMEFTDDGVSTCYDKDGNMIRTGKFSVSGYNPNGEWKVGDLVTTSILWPYEINSGGNNPGTFEIVYLTADKMTLVYPDGGDYGSLGNWGEATFWQFKSNSDVEGILAGFGEGNSWTWNPDALDGVIWGNMGYCGGPGANAVASGKWWGVTSEEEFAGQLQHSNTGALTGEESLDAYMTFTPEGQLKKFDASGKQLNDGTFSVDLVEGNEWKVANLNTSAGAILWPFEINSGGNMPTTFEVVDLTGDKMTLVYPDGGAFDGLGGWGEATFWQFKKK
jgi:hypothetical protein